MTIDEILEVVLEAVEEYNLQVDDDQKVEPSVETVLFGRGGKLDSMGLVNMIVLVEEKINTKFDVNITLADERAVSQEKSPFRSVQSLADYLLILVKEQELA